MTRRRPNFLVIQADQLAAQAIDAYGNPIAGQQHCPQADKAYSNWAYEDVLGYRFPEEE